jgi:hypothetical protein
MGFVHTTILLMGIFAQVVGPELHQQDLYSLQITPLIEDQMMESSIRTPRGSCERLSS